VIFADTSFLVSLYSAEKETTTAQGYMLRAAQSLTYTPFHRLELRTALRRRVFRKTISTEEMRGAFQIIEGDLQEGILEHRTFNWIEALRQAEELAEAHLTQVGTRSGDLLLVAIACVLGAGEFVTFDQRQALLAKRAGLKVKTWR
jgi:predicted nucleic acid-binding protein